MPSYAFMHAECALKNVYPFSATAEITLDIFNKNYASRVNAKKSSTKVALAL